MPSRLKTFCAMTATLLLGACTYSPPDCDKPELIKGATDVVNGQDDVKALGITVKEVRNMKETAHDDAKNTRTCTGEMELSNGQIMDLTIDLAQDPKDQTVFIPTIRWTPRD